MDDEQKQPQIEPQGIEQAPQQTVEPKSPQAVTMSRSRWQRIRSWYGSHKKWAIPATVLVVLLIVAAVPWSRYKAAGIVVKKNFTIEVLDSSSRSPVSDATVSAGAASAQTDGNGRATIHLSAGNHSILISKKYYKEHRANVLVPILSQKNTPSIEVAATGRQVKIIIKNLITQKTLGDVDIKVADITAKTDKSGEAIVVLPAGASEQKATLSLEGYNNSGVSVKISGNEVLENSFNLTPTGKVYFISKRSGKLDLMKANLDGTEAKVVVAATGKEREDETILLQSPDLKYVAFLTRRTTTYPTPQLYIMSTDDESLLSVDNAKAHFKIIGWSGNSLIYQVSRDDLPESQPGREKLKSYNASTGKITLLTQTAAATDPENPDNSLYEYIAYIMINGENVAYAKNWNLSFYELTDPLEGKKHSVSVIGADGLNNKVLASYDAIDYNLGFVQHKPNAFYINQHTDDGKLDKYYEYVFGSASTKSANIDSETFSDSYDKFFYNSPSGQKAAWSEYRDGKYTILVGDPSGLNPKEISSLDQYDVYSWFSDDYLLVFKDVSELYIMSAQGGKPVKVTDFQPSYLNPNAFYGP